MMCQNAARSYMLSKGLVMHGEHKCVQNVCVVIAVCEGNSRHWRHHILPIVNGESIMVTARVLCRSCPTQRRCSSPLQPSVLATTLAAIMTMEAQLGGWASSRRRVLTSEARLRSSHAASPRRQRIIPQ